jgi:hypothetical protein
MMLGLVFAACRPEAGSSDSTAEPAPTRSKAEVVAVAKAAAMEAFGRLSGRLGEAMADGGPVRAIPVCAAEAGTLTREVATEHGLEMQRLSDRPRRAGQEALGEDLEVLRAMRDEPAPQVEWVENGGATVRLPIVLDRALCLKCHGGPDDIDQETRAVLAELYPQDRATGYRLGDLRGIWRIEVPPLP